MLLENSGINQIICKMQYTKLHYIVSIQALF